MGMARPRPAYPRADPLPNGIVPLLGSVPAEPFDMTVRPRKRRRTGSLVQRLSPSYNEDESFFENEFWKRPENVDAAVVRLLEWHRGAGVLQVLCCAAKVSLRDHTRLGHSSSFFFSFLLLLFFSPLNGTWTCGTLLWFACCKPTGVSTLHQAAQTRAGKP